MTGGWSDNCGSYDDLTAYGMVYTQGTKVVLLMVELELVHTSLEEFRELGCGKQRMKAAEVRLENPAF